jgi:hypothetical protein
VIALIRSRIGRTLWATRIDGLFVPVGFGALALTVLALSVPLHVNVVAVGLAVAALALVVARMALALRENHALLAGSRIEAATAR